MQVKVPDDVLKVTKECPHKFSCLSSDQSDHRKTCEVKHILGADLMFLNDSRQAHCPYRLMFGNGQICTCPVHYAVKSKADKKELL
ncbi:MAG TPA: hypothetical protein VMU29_13840 [Smithella sp.]|nr:hypothetical protein [Smithella sp.]